MKRKPEPRRIDPVEVGLVGLVAAAALLGILWWWVTGPTAHPLALSEPLPDGQGPAQGPRGPRGPIGSPTPPSRPPAPPPTERGEAYRAALQAACDDDPTGCVVVDCANGGLKGPLWSRGVFVDADGHAFAVRRPNAGALATNIPEFADDDLGPVRTWTVEANDEGCQIYPAPTLQIATLGFPDDCEMLYLGARRLQTSTVSLPVSPEEPWIEDVFCHGTDFRIRSGQLIIDRDTANGTFHFGEPADFSAMVAEDVEGLAQQWRKELEAAVPIDALHRLADGVGPEAVAASRLVEAALEPEVGLSELEEHLRNQGRTRP